MRSRKGRERTYTTRITPNNEMPGIVKLDSRQHPFTMNSPSNQREKTYPPRMRIPLQLRLPQIPVIKAIDILVLRDGAVRVVCAGADGRELVDVAAQAARVGAEPVGARVVGDAAYDGGLEAEGDDHAAGVLAWGSCMGRGRVVGGGLG